MDDGMDGESINDLLTTPPAIPGTSPVELVLCESTPGVSLAVEPEPVCVPVPVEPEVGSPSGLTPEEPSDPATCPEPVLSPDGILVELAAAIQVVDNVVGVLPLCWTAE